MKKSDTISIALTLSLALSLFLFLPSSLQAQRSATTSGEYTLQVPEDLSLQQAKQACTDRARIDAIEQAFGRAVIQGNASYIINQSGDSSFTEDIFYSVGESVVNGEFIKDMEAPACSTFLKDGYQWVHCEVKIKARERKEVTIQFEAAALQCPVPTCQSTRFQDGGDFFLSFRSANSGYLTVYLLDALGTAYRLLPYQDSPAGLENAVLVEADKSYIIGSPDQPAFGYRPAQVDEFFLYTDRPVERNQIMLIFNEAGPLRKPFLEKGDEKQAPGRFENMRMPDQIGAEAFQKWLAQNHEHNRDLQVKRIFIDIYK